MYIYKYTYIYIYIYIYIYTYICTYKCKPQTELQTSTWPATVSNRFVELSRPTVDLGPDSSVNVLSRKRRNIEDLPAPYSPQRITLLERSERYAIHGGRCRYTLTFYS